MYTFIHIYMYILGSLFSPSKRIEQTVTLLSVIKSYCSNNYILLSHFSKQINVQHIRLI